MKKNLAPNDKEKKSQLSAIDGSCPIFSQNALSGLQYGSYCTSYNGCSWISIYNASYLLGAPFSAENIISWMESRGVFRGLVFKGLLGAYPWSVGGFFKKHGFNVSYAFRKKTISKKAANSKASILFYIRPDFTGHYVAFFPVKNAKDSYHFLNEIPGKENDIRSISDFLGASKKLIRLGIFIN